MAVRGTPAPDRLPAARPARHEPPPGLRDAGTVHARLRRRAARAAGGRQRGAQRIRRVGLGRHRLHSAGHDALHPRLRRRTAHVAGRAARAAPLDRGRFRTGRSRPQQGGARHLPLRHPLRDRTRPHRQLPGLHPADRRDPRRPQLPHLLADHTGEQGSRPRPPGTAPRRSRRTRCALCSADTAGERTPGPATRGPGCSAWASRRAGVHGACRGVFRTGPSAPPRRGPGVRRLPYPSRRQALERDVVPNPHPPFEATPYAGCTHGATGVRGRGCGIARMRVMRAAAGRAFSPT